MPVEVGIWKLGDRPQRVEFTPLDLEDRLEKALSQDLSILAPDLLLVGCQVVTAHRKEIDILAIDPEGTLHVLELKRGQTPREVVAQLLDYGSWIQTLTYDDITRIFSDKNAGKSFEVGFDERFGTNPPEDINSTHRLYVVATDLDSSTERILNYISGYGVPINALFFRYFRDGQNEYITRSWLISPEQAATSIGRSKAKGGSEPWNGRDYYVAFGESNQRSWDDAIRYGFVSAGGGKKWSGPLYNLQVDNRISVCIPGTGYVGIGIVRETAVPVSDFRVDVNGTSTPIMEAPIKAPDLKAYAVNPDTYEHFVKVEWLKTLPRTQAFWQKGMFANQNVVCRLKNKFTLDKLAEHFHLDEE